MPSPTELNGAGVRYKRYMLQTDSCEETHHFGQWLGAHLKGLHLENLDMPPTVVALYGDLGAGKTTLTQGIAHGLGIEQPVTSPTFTLINEYLIDEGRLPRINDPKATLLFIHMDSYRLGDIENKEDSAAEAEAMGVDELFEQENSVIVIEWAEKIASLLPADRLDISLTYSSALPSQRQITCIATGSQAGEILESLNHYPHG